MSKSSKSRLYNPNHAIVSLGVFSAGESSSVVFLSCVKCRGKVKHRTEDAVSFPLFWAFQGSVVFCSVTPWGAGGNGGSGGRELQTPAVTHAGVGQKPTQSWKAVILQLKKHKNCRNFPGVQALRCHTPSAGGRGSIPGQETDPTCHS